MTRTAKLPYAAALDQILECDSPQTKMPHPNGLSTRARRASGETVVSQLMAKTLALPDLISLAAGFVDYESLPVEATAAATATILRDTDRAKSALQYGTTIGYPPLRRAILERMLHADGCTEQEVGLSLDQVVITAGSNQLLHHLGEVLLDPGDLVLCAAPSYFVYLDSIASLGATTFGIESDESGMIPEALDAQLANLERSGKLPLVKAVYITSYFDNPASVTVSRERRPELVEIVRRYSRYHRIYIIEDVAYRELRYRGDDVPSIRAFDEEATTVVQAGTFSKSFSPGIRIGWGILPRALVGPVLNQKGHLDFGTANFNQMMMAEIFAQGHFDPHITRLRDCYRSKADAALAAAEKFLGPIPDVDWVRTTGGLYIWVRLPESVDAGLNGVLFARAVEEGVLYVPGEVCYPSAGFPVKKNRIRLSFGIQSRESIARGIEALARAIRGVM